MATLQQIASLLRLSFAFLLCFLAPQYLSHAALILALISGASYMASEIQSSERSELAAWTREQSYKKEFDAYKAAETTKYDDFTASHRNKFEKMEDEYAGVRSINARLADENLELRLKLQTTNNNLSTLRAMSRGNTSGCTKMHYSHPAAETARRNEDLENRLDTRARELLKARATITSRDNEIAKLHKSIQQQTLNGQLTEASCTALRVSAQKDQKKIVRLERLLQLAMAPRPTMTSTLSGPDIVAPPPVPTVSAQAAAEMASKLKTTENRATEILRQKSSADTEILRLRNMLTPLQQKLDDAATFCADVEKRALATENAREQAQKDANHFYSQTKELSAKLTRLSAGLTEFGAKAAYIKALSSHNGSAKEPALPVLSALSVVHGSENALLEPLVSALALLPSAHATARSQKFDDMVNDFSQRYKALSQSADAPPTSISPDILTTLTSSDEDFKLTKPLLNALGDWAATKIMYQMVSETLVIVQPEMTKYNAAAERSKAAPEWVLAKSAPLRDDRLGAVEGKRRRGMVEECGKKMEFVRGLVKETSER